MLKKLSLAVILAAASFVTTAVPAAASVIFTSGETADAGNAAPAGTHGAFGGALGPGGAVGGIGGPIGFVVPYTGTFFVSVDDCCLVGDVYQLFVDGTSVGDTSPEPIGGSTNSSGIFSVFLTAGAHSFDIADIILQYVGFASPYGGGLVTQDYTPAGLTVTVSETPEPATVALIGIALLGLLGFGTLRWRETA